MGSSEKLEDADLKQFDKMFVELVAESTSDDDQKLADVMQWFKRVSEWYNYWIEYCYL